MDVQRDNDALAGCVSYQLMPVSLDNGHLKVSTPVTIGEGGGRGVEEDAGAEAERRKWWRKQTG
jgi:hypothetical protein